MEVARVNQTILALNCGSSSLKFGLYASASDGISLLFEGEGEELGKSNSAFWFKARDGEKQNEQLPLPDHRTALEHSLSLLKKSRAPTPDAVGHRIVHGGAKVQEHQLLTPALLEQLRAATDFAPLHAPPALKTIEAAQGQLPNIPQAICLDTAFHLTMPDVSRLFALPAKVRDLGVHRYGFHGLSLESILPQLEAIPPRLVVAHLGGGCSVTAIRKGESIDTSMGLTPTGGIMMGTRCGDLDPGVVLYLMRNGFGAADELEQLFDHDSGLLGVSGLSSDIRDLEKKQGTNPDADLARRMFVYQLCKSIAAMAAATEGLDLLVFTGGIGEHNSSLREEVVRRLSFLGQFESKALPAQEDLQIATVTARLTAA